MGRPPDYKWALERHMSKPANPPPAPQQIELFDSWFAATDETDNSRTLAFWDVIPWRLLSHKRKGKLPEIIAFEGVRIDEQREATVLLTPAFLRDPDSKETRVLFPSVREELVERALRKMAVHKLAATQLQSNPQDNSLAVAISFSLYQLRQELIHTGHGHKLADIREALQVMRLCDVAVECQGDSFVHGKAGPILPTLEFVADPNDTDGKRTLYRATFHPLACAAILGEFYHPINYMRVMTLTQPLARWITNLLNARFRYATRGIGEQKRSFRLTLKRVLTDSGMHKEPRLFDNIERIREAIKELRESGFLDRGVALEQIETLKYEKTAGRPKIIGAEWDLYPSDRFAREIIEGNQAKKSRGDKPRGKEALKGLPSCSHHCYNLRGRKH